MNKETGEPAFPKAGDFNPQMGMTLRDYFAAKIMQSYMMNGIWREDVYELAAKTAYQVADAMLKAREQ